jgi:hypothetical protein
MGLEYFLNPIHFPIPIKIASPSRAPNRRDSVDFFVTRRDWFVPGGKGANKGWLDGMQRR